MRQRTTLPSNEQHNSLKSCNSLNKVSNQYKGLIIFVASILLIALIKAWSINHQPTNNFSQQSPNIQLLTKTDDNDVYQPKFISEYNPTTKRTVNYMYQLPPPRQAGGLNLSNPYPRGVVLLLHGYARACTDFWAPSTACLHCSGYPIELNITQYMLERGLVTLALCSSNVQSKCWQVSWDTQTTTPDYQSTYQALHKVHDVVLHTYPSPPTPPLPLYIFGASSGGAFALSLPLHPPPPAQFRLAGVIAQIMAAPVHGLLTQEAGEGGRVVYPPVVFMHMARDQRTAAKVQDNIRELRDAGVRVREDAVHPSRSSANDVCDGNVTVRAANADCEKTFQGFVKWGWVSEAGEMLVNPRTWGGQKAKLSNGVLEIMNYRYAGHEIIWEGVQEAMEWIGMGE